MSATYPAEWACNKCGAVMTLSPGEEPCCGGGVHKVNQGDAFRCSCDESDPDTSGPAEDCPEHGDVRVYAKWLNDACIAYDEREVEFKQLLADQAATTAELWMGHHSTKVCDAEKALEPAESIALTAGWAQVQRGEHPSPNVAVVCVATLARLTGCDGAS